VTFRAASDDLDSLPGCARKGADACDASETWFSCKSMGSGVNRQLCCSGQPVVNHDACTCSTALGPAKDDDPDSGPKKSLPGCKTLSAKLGKKCPEPMVHGTCSDKGGNRQHLCCSGEVEADRECTCNGLECVRCDNHPPSPQSSSGKKGAAKGAAGGEKGMEEKEKEKEEDEQEKEEKEKDKEKEKEKEQEKEKEKEKEEKEKKKEKEEEKDAEGAAGAAATGHMLRYKDASEETQSVAAQCFHRLIMFTDYKKRDLEPKTAHRLCTCFLKDPSADMHMLRACFMKSTQGPNDGFLDCYAKVCPDNAAEMKSILGDNEVTSSMKGELSLHVPHGYFGVAIGAALAFTLLIVAGFRTHRAANSGCRQTKCSEGHHLLRTGALEALQNE